MMLLRALLLALCLPCGGCVGMLPETIYADVSSDEAGHRVYRTGGTWRPHWADATQ